MVLLTTRSVRPVFVVIVETRNLNDSCFAMERGNEGIKTEETTHELVLLNSVICSRRVLS